MQQEIPIIKSLKDIKYSDLAKFREIVNLSNDEGDTETFLRYKILSIFYGIKQDKARQLQPEVFERCIHDVLVAIQDKPILNQQIIIEDTIYGLIPNFGKVSAGELIDLDNLYLENDLPAIMSILYRPIVGKINNKGEYIIEEYQGYNDKFKDISAYYVEGVLGFFYRSFQILNHCIPSSIV